MKICFFQSVVRCSIQLSYGRPEQANLRRKAEPSNKAQRMKKFTAAFEIRNDYAGRVMELISRTAPTLQFNTTEAESFPFSVTSNQLKSVHSRNSATGE